MPGLVWSQAVYRNYCWRCCYHRHSTVRLSAGTNRLVVYFRIWHWFIIMGLFYARPLRNSGLMTISEFLVVNFGKKAGPIASLSATAGIFFSIVASMLTSIHLIVGLFHVSLVAAASIIIVIVAALVFFGGINSSGMAGIFKILLVFATVFVGGILSYNDLGGLTGIRESFPAFPWLSLFGKGIEDSLFSLFSMVYWGYFYTDLCTGSVFGQG